MLPGSTGYTGWLYATQANQARPAESPPLPMLTLPPYIWSRVTSHHLFATRTQIPIIQTKVELAGSKHALGAFMWSCGESTWDGQKKVGGLVS